MVSQSAQNTAQLRSSFTMGVFWGTLDQKWSQLAAVPRSEIDLERRIIAVFLVIRSKWQQ
jgi:hypothetical protein